MDGSDKPRNVGNQYTGPGALPLESSTNNSNADDSISHHSPSSYIAKEGSKTPQKPINTRPISVYNPELNPIAGPMQAHLDNFCCTGSAHAFLSLLNSQKGIDGTFEIVFQPRNGKPPIPINEFSKSGNEKIQSAYEQASQQIAINSQSIAYRLLEDMAMRQQQMFANVMQQQAAIQNQMQPTYAGLLQSMMQPVIQPMPVPFNYLMGFAGHTMPQQPASMMNWGAGGVTASPSQPSVLQSPVWQQYSQPMMALQPSLQKPLNYPQLPSGFCAVPAAPPQAGFGLQIPFSPLGHALQQQPAGPGAQWNGLPQFCQTQVQSLIPPWSYSHFQQKGKTPNIIINNLTRVSPRIPSYKNDMPGKNHKPDINIEVNPVINNSISEKSKGNGSYRRSEVTQQKVVDDKNKTIEVLKDEISFEKNKTDAAISAIRKKIDSLNNGIDQSLPIEELIRKSEELKNNRSYNTDQFDSIKQDRDAILSVLEANLNKRVDIDRLLSDLIGLISKLSDRNDKLVNTLNERDGLHDKIKDMHDQVNRLKKDNEEGKEKYNQLYKKLQRVENNNKHMQASASQVDDIGSDLIEDETIQNMVDNLRNQLVKCKENLKIKEDKIKSLEGEISKLHNNAGVDKGEINKLKEKLDNLKREFKKEKSKVEALEREINNFKKENLSELSKLNKNKNITDNEIKGLKREVSELQKSSKKKEGNVKELKHDLDQARASDNKNKSELDELRQNLEKERNEQLINKNKIQSLEGQLEEKMKLLEKERTAEGELKGYKDQIENTEKGIKENEDKIKQLENQVNELKGENESIKGERDRITIEANDNKKGIDNLQNKIKALSTQDQGKNDQIHALENQVEKLVALKDSLDKELNKNQLDHDNAIENLEKLLNNNNEEIDKLKQELEKAGKKIEDSKGIDHELENNKKELYQLLDDKKVLADELSRIKQEKESYDSTTDTLNKKIEELENKIRDLQEDSNNNVTIKNNAIREKEAEIDRLKGEIDAFEVEKIGNEGKIKDLEDDIKEKEQELENIKNELNDNKDKYAQLDNKKQDDILAKEEEIRKLQDFVEFYEVKSSESDKELQKLQEEYSKKEKEFKEALSNNVDELTSAKDTCQKAIDSIEEKIADAKDNVSKKENEIKALTASINTSNSREQEYSQKNEILSDEIEKLKKEKDSLNSSQKEAKQIIDNLNKKIANLEQDIKNNNDKIEELDKNNENEELKKQIQDLLRNCEETESELAKLKSERDNLISSLEEEKDKIKILNESIDSFQKSSEENNNNIDDLREKLSKAENDISKQTQKVEELSAELEENKATGEKTSEELLNEIKKAKDNIEKLENEKRDLTLEIKQKNNEINTLNQTIKDCKNDIENKNNTISRLEGELKEYKLSITNKDNEITRIKAELEEIQDKERKSQEEIEAISNELGEKESDIENLENEIDTLNSNLEKERDDKESLQASIAAFKNDIKNKNDELINIKEKLNKAEDDISRQEQEIEELSKEIQENNNEGKKESEELSNKLKEAQNNLKKLEDEKKALAIDLDKKTNEINELKQKIKNLENKIEAKDNKINGLEKELKAIKLQLDKSANKEQESKEKIEDISKEFREKENDIENLKNERDTLNSNLEEERDEKKSLQASIAVFQNDIKDKDDELINIKEELNKAEDDIVRQTQKIEELKGNKATGEKTNEELLNSLKEAQDNLKKLEDEKNTLTFDLDKKTNEINKLNQEIKKLNNDIENKNTKINALEKALAEIKLKLDESANKEQKSKEEIDTISNELKEKECELKELKNDKKDLESAIEDYKGTLDSVQENYDKAVGDRDNLKKSLEENHAIVLQRDSSIEQLEKQLKDKEEEIEKLKTSIDNISSAKNSTQLALDEVEKNIDVKNNEAIKKQNELNGLQEKVDSLSKQLNDDKLNADKYAKKLENQLKRADNEKNGAMQEIENFKSELEKVKHNSIDSIQGTIKKYFPNNKNMNYDVSALLKNFEENNFGVEELKEAIEKLMKMVEAALSSQDTVKLEIEKYKKALNEVKAIELPKTLNASVVTGVENFELEMQCHKGVLDVLQSILNDLNSNIANIKEGKNIGSTVVDEIIKQIDAVKNSISHNKDECSKVIGVVDKIKEAFTGVDKDKTSIIKDAVERGCNETGNLADEINDKVITCLYSDLSEKEEGISNSSMRFQKIASSHRALKHLQFALIEIVNVEKKYLENKKSKNTLKSIEQYRAYSENIRKGIEKLKTENLGNIANLINEDMRVHWDQYINLALIEHDINVTKLEKKDKVSVIDRMKNIDGIDQAQKNLLGNLSGIFKNENRKFEGIDKATKLLEENEDFLESVLSMLPLLKDSNHSIEKGKKDIYGGNYSDLYKLKTAQSMLSNILDHHHISEHFTPAEILLSLASLATKINSKVIEVAAERYNSSPGYTKDGGLRSKKIIDQCLKYLAIECNHKKHFWRGLPVSDNTQSVASHPHAKELNCFKENNFITFYDWGNTIIKDGLKKGKMLSGGSGLLETFFSKRESVDIKEYVAVGERFISHRDSPLVFQQKKDGKGEFGRVTVDINGSKREISPRLYLTYPKYVSPFKGMSERDSIPLASMLTEEVGELVQTCDKGKDSFSEYYYRVVNEGEFPNSVQVLKCIPITTKKPVEEEFTGSVMGWLACHGKKGQENSANTLAQQAWSAYRSLHWQNNSKNLKEDFKNEVLKIANRKVLQGHSWFTSAMHNNFKESMSSYKFENKDHMVGLDQGKSRPLSRSEMSNVPVILPDSLSIENARRHDNREAVELLSKDNLDSSSLSPDFNYHFEESIDLLESYFGKDHPSLKSIIDTKRKEKDQFAKDVFYDRYTLKGVLLEGSSDSSKSIQPQIKAMTQLVKHQLEESMGYVADCSILEQKVLMMMPETRKPCSIEEAKQYFGKYDMSVEFAQTMMAYLAAESARDISKGLERDMKALLGELKTLNVNALRINANEYKNQCSQLNKKNFNIARRKRAMRERLLDGLSTQELDAKNIAAKKYENTKGTLLRDYQLNTARKLLEDVHTMAENYKSDDDKRRESHHRVYCQLGTGFGKTELTKMLMSQACLEGIGAGYIAPKSNVENYNQDMWHHTKAAGERFQPIDLAKMFNNESTSKFWWNDIKNLERIHNIIQGLPEDGNNKSQESKIPWTMSTADLGALLFLHGYMADQKAKVSSTQKDHAIYAKLEQIVNKISGASRENRPLIIRDEHDMYNDSTLISEHCKNVLNMGVNNEEGKENLQLRLGYDFSIHNGIFLSASKDSDYVSMIRAEADSLKALAETSNKDVTTCELRAEQYLLKSKWRLVESQDLSETVQQALNVYGDERNLVFCDPTYQNKGGSMNMAFEGMNALEAIGGERVDNLKGHLYFKDGHYYCYSDKLDRYKHKECDNQGTIIAFGAQLSEADEAEVRKTGGSGYITWMSETRGYTAAQKNEEPNTTAFIFRNISTLSTPERQQLLGRDRNIDPYGAHDNLVIFSSDELKGDSKASKKIIDEAITKWNTYREKKQSLGKLKSPDVIKAAECDIEFNIKDKGKNESEGSALKRNLLKAIDKKHEEWKAIPELKEHAEEMKEYAIARWEAIDIVKNKALTAIAFDIDFSKGKNQLEDNAEIAAKRALLDGLYQQEVDFIKIDIIKYVESYRETLKESLRDKLSGIFPSNTMTENQCIEICDNIANKVINDINRELGQVTKNKNTDSGVTALLEYKAGLKERVGDMISTKINTIFSNIDYVSNEDNLIPLESQLKDLKDNAGKELEKIAKAVSKFKSILNKADFDKAINNKDSVIKKLDTLQMELRKNKQIIFDQNKNDVISFHKMINGDLNKFLKIFCEMKPFNKRSFFNSELFKKLSKDILEKFLDLEGARDQYSIGSSNVENTQYPGENTKSFGSVSSGGKTKIVFSINSEVMSYKCNIQNKDNKKLKIEDFRKSADYEVLNKQKIFRSLMNASKKIQTTIKEKLNDMKLELADSLTSKEDMLATSADRLKNKLKKQAEVKVPKNT